MPKLRKHLRGPMSQKTTKIRRLRPMAIVGMSRMFAGAVTQHFSYFPAAYQAELIRGHRPLKLARAALDPRRILLTAHHKRRLVGYAVGASPADGRAQLFWLYVDPTFRGGNTGLKLLSRLIKIAAKKGAREVVLVTRDYSDYYRRQGFTPLGRRQVDGVEMDVMSFRVQT
jgi:ribosomal protein S18 acetylase RimI-like enzyme